MDRDAVCAGDDMNHHREKFTVPDDITIAGLFKFLSSLGMTWSGHSIITKMNKELILLGFRAT